MINATTEPRKDIMRTLLATIYDIYGIYFNAKLLKKIHKDGDLFK